MMILLTEEEMKALRPDVPVCSQTVFDCEGCSARCGLTAKAQLKKDIESIEGMADWGLYLSEILQALKKEV